MFQQLPLNLHLMPNDQPLLGRPMAYIPPRSISPKAPRLVKSSSVFDLEERLRKLRMPINTPTTTTTDSSTQTIGNSPNPSTWWFDD